MQTKIYKNGYILGDLLLQYLVQKTYPTSSEILFMITRAKSSSNSCL